MKRLLYKLGAQSVMTAVMLLLVLSPYQALLAQAQVGAESSASAVTPAAINTGVNSASASSNNSGGVGGVDNGTSIGCNFTTAVGSGVGTTFAICLTNMVYIFTVGIGSAFAYVAAYFFDLAVQLSLNGTAYALTFVSTGWTTARDLANMAFLFILLFIAFQIMFSAETSNTMSTLALVIVVALLVNFSFFFTRVVIDAGNILSIEFYNSISAPSLSATTAAGITSGNLPGQSTAAAAAQALGQNGNTKDLTSSIMGMLQLQNLFNTTSFDSFINGNKATGQPAAGGMVVAIALTFLYIAAGIMFWFLSIMFITTGVKFLTRIVVLWFLIIFSPLAFVARAVPQFRKYFDQWQSELIKTAFYPVAFMFIFLILTNFAAQLSCTVNGQAVSGCAGLINDVFGSLNQGTGITAIGYAVANVALRLGFVIAILYMGMQAAQNFSVMGASSAQKGFNWLGGKALGYSAASLGFAGRQTFGRLSNTAYKTANVNAATQNTFTGNLWRGATKRLASATYDVRNAPGASFLKKSVGSSAIGTVDTGKAATKGFQEQAKERSEKEKKEKAERAAIVRDDVNKKTLERIAQDLENGRTPVQADVDRVKNMNKREMESHGADKLIPLAHLFKESQKKTFNDSDKYTDDEKEKFEKSWHEKSSGAPLQKANEIISKLNDINRTLTTAAKFGPITPGTTISKASIETSLKLIDDKIDEAETRRDAILPTDTANRAVENKNLSRLKKVQEHYKKLDEERKNVPENIGGERDSGKFKSV